VLLTLTTRVGDMLNVFRRALGWTSRFGVDVEKASLAISLAIRFVPLIAEITAQVREAQAARGLEHNVFAVAMPVLHRTIKMAGDIADAIDAR
ncbi:energy-coupling factor transporter transmembrane component T, partial [Acinetobacter baumannii]